MGVVKKKLVISVLGVVFCVYFLSYILKKGSNGGVMITITTTTTTTPTPTFLLSQVKRNSSAIVFEKYDALKVHANIMRRKVSRMTSHLSRSDDVRTNNVTMNANVHMFFSDYLRRKMKDNEAINERNATLYTINENLRTSRLTGAGVIFVICSRLSNSGISQTARTHFILRTLFHSAPQYGIKISIAINHYMKSNVMSIRRDIHIFLSMYKDEEALYKVLKPGRKLLSVPVIYVMDSYMIPASEWLEVLLPRGRFSLRNTGIDSFILGHVNDQQHTTHIRQSHFDGFFTCCSYNGETFASTWKNWQALSVWANSHGLAWSAGATIGVGGPLALEMAYKTALRCQPRPQFLSLSNHPLTDEYLHVSQLWLKKWPGEYTLKNVDSP